MTNLNGVSENFKHLQYIDAEKKCVRNICYEKTEGQTDTKE